MLYDAYDVHDVSYVYDVYDAHVILTYNDDMILLIYLIGKCFQICYSYLANLLANTCSLKMLCHQIR